MQLSTTRDVTYLTKLTLARLTFLPIAPVQVHPDDWTQATEKITLNDSQGKIKSDNTKKDIRLKGKKRDDTF